MEKKEIISILEEFNKSAEELFNLSFIKKLNDSGCTIRWNREKGFETELRGPDDESIKAFCNDIRKFFQKNDSLKIHKLIPIYKSSFVEESERGILNKTMSDFDKFKKKVSNYTINGENLTNEKILEVFLYGKISHRTEGIKEEHDKWERITPMYVSLKSYFIGVLSNYLVVVSNVTYANKMILEKLKQNQQITN